MIERAKIITADFYTSPRRKFDKQVLELTIELDDYDSAVIMVNGMHLIQATYKVFTLKELSEQSSVEEALSELEGMTIRVDIIDGNIVAMFNHLKKYVIMVSQGEVVF